MFAIYPLAASHALQVSRSLILCLVRSMLRDLLAGALAIGIAAAASANSGDGQLPKHLLAAPRPSSPEISRGHWGSILGDGLGCKAILEVDYHSGIVKEVKIPESTGKPILDQTVINTLQRWRFEADTTTHAEILICFSTLGVTYGPCTKI